MHNENDERCATADRGLSKYSTGRDTTHLSTAAAAAAVARQRRRAAHGHLWGPLRRMSAAVSWSGGRQASRWGASEAPSCGRD